MTIKVKALSTISFIISALLSINLCAQDPSLPILTEENLEARNQQQTLLSIPQFGRYSIRANSEQGTAIQVIDKMLGPMAISGQAGKVNGRWDGFLDRGEYKLKTYSHKNGLGKAIVSALSFTNLNVTPPEQLIEHKLVQSTLKDLQQRVYWINIQRRQTIFIESAGRSLADMRLWKDGSWLVDAEPVQNIRHPQKGKALSVYTITADLNPGLYQLIAYGGPALDWAEDTAEKDSHPFYLRRGIPTLPQTGRHLHSTSPFGLDHFLVPAKADYFRLELKNKGEASLQVQTYNQHNVHSQTGRFETITKNKVLPIAEIKDYSASRGLKLISVRAEAGQEYILQHFWAARRVVVTPGNYFVSSLHSGAMGDSVDATALLTSNRNNRESFIDDRAVSINLKQHWHRRFNLLEQLNLFVEITEAGAYRVSAEGVNAEYRFEPFLTRRPSNYQAPEYRSLNTAWNLDKGFYVLTINPRFNRSGNTGGKGIVNIAISADDPQLASTVLQQTPLSGPGFVRFNNLSVGRNERYTLRLNKQPGVISGIDLRSLPIDLSEDFSLFLAPNESISLPIEIPDDGKLNLMTEDSSAVAFLLKAYTRSQNNEQEHQSSAAVEKGLHQLQIKNPSDKNLSVFFSFRNHQQLNQSGLPPLPDNVLDQLPQFHSIDENNPQYLSLSRQQSQTFNLNVKEPALYRLESSGLIQTQGSLRTRVNTNFDRQSSNGVGRNFLVQQYLREGEYQITVEALGKTQGDIGVHLMKNALLDGGELSIGNPSRFTLPSGHGLAYEFNIHKQGKYQIHSYSLNGSLPVRLEDEQGWPLITPGSKSYLSQHFSPGRYRYVLMPGALEQRVITEFDYVSEIEKNQGHGPFSLQPGKTVKHRWLEPPLARINADDFTEEDRQADVWNFTLSANATVTLFLSQGMVGNLRRVNSNGILSEIVGNKIQELDLDAGHYRLDLKSERINNRFDYSIRVDTKQLLVGQNRQVKTESKTQIAIGKTGITEINSRGHHDVKAKLFNASGQLVASNDDRNNDWNFSIIKHLQAGNYRLELKPSNTNLTGSNVFTEVSVIQPAITDHDPISLPTSTRLSDSNIHRYIFTPDSVKGLLAISAQGPDPVAISIEKRVDEEWLAISSKADINPLSIIAIDNTNQYRISFWLPDRRPVNIQINIDNLAINEFSEYDWGKGFDPVLTQFSGFDISANLIRLNRPGIFQRQDSKSSTHLLWSSAVDTPLQAAPAQLNSGESKQLWLVSLHSPSQELKGKRLQLSSSLYLELSESPSLIDSSTKAKQLTVVTSQARNGIAGARYLQDQSRKNSFGIDGDTSAIVFINNSERNTNTQVALWKAYGGQLTLPTKVTQHHFDLTAPLQLRQGLSDIQLAQHSVVSYSLNAGIKNIQLSLSAETGAAFYQHNKLQKVLWSGSHPNNYSINTNADEMIVFNTSNTIKTLPLLHLPIQSNHTLQNNKLQQHYFSTKGINELSFENNTFAAQTLSLLSDDKLNNTLTVIHSNGQIERGLNLEVVAGDRLLVKHQAGQLSLWTRPNEATLNSVVDPSIQAQKLSLNLNSIWNLSDPQTLIETNSDELQFVLAQSPIPMAVRRQHESNPQQINLYRQSLKDIWIFPRGKHSLLIEPLKTKFSDDSIYLQTLDPIQIKEGLGPKITLGPSEARLFSFSIDKLESDNGHLAQDSNTKDIGIGVKASIDIARCRLFNQDGSLVGQGINQFHQLQAGNYYLLIDIPGTGRPISIQAAVVGLDPPSQHPPVEIEQSYRQLVQPEPL